jgi:hypothetical protein
LAKIDWQKHCAEFLSLQDTSAAARRDYCESNGLNPNSFRRELATYSQSKSQETPPKKADKKTKPTTKAALDKPKKETKSKAPDQVTHTDARRTTAKVGSQKTTQIPKTNITINSRPNVETRPNGTRTFTKGNTAAMKHGGYSSVMSSLDLEMEPDDLDLSDMGRILKTRILGMSRIRRDRMNGIADMYEKGNKLTRTYIGPDGEERQEPMTLIEAMESVEYSGIEPFSRLMSQLVLVEEKTVSIEKNRRDISAMTKSEVVELTAAILMQRSQENLTAVDTCHLFASKGIEPPKLLLMEAEKEIKTAEPEPDENGVTEEELAEARATAKKNRQQEDESFRKEREGWLKQILEESGQVGEVKETISDDSELFTDGGESE